MTRRPLCLLLLLSGAACSLLGQIGILSTSPLPPAYVGLPYTYSFSAFVQAPLPAATWSTQTSPATPPPPGLTLSPNGTLSGTPTTPTNLLPYTFTVVAQTGDFSVSMQFQMTVSNPVVVINTTSLPSAVLNQPYSFTLSASSNPAGVTWSVGSPGLAPGLSLSPNGVLSGAVSPTGTFYMNFIATITGTNVSTNYTIPLTVYAGQVVIQTTSIPQAQSGNAYSVTLAATPTGVTWAETGSLPVGITFNSTTGVLSGVTNAIGTYPIQVTASLTSWASASQNLILYVNTGTLAIPQTSLPAAVQGSPYAGSIRVTGGLPPYQWALVSTGNDGLSIGSTTGGVTGTPTAAGNFLLTVMVTDASGVSVTQALSLFVATPLQVATTSLPAATVGVAYSQILLPGGGVGPYVWNVVTGSGTLPPGLTLSGPGTLSGTPTNNGTSTFTVQVTDSGGRSATGTLSLSVSLGTLSITTSSLPNGQLSTPYSQTVTASGGAPPYTWTVASGGLPGGLGLATSSSGTGVISGTPTGPLGTIAFTLQVTDSNKLTAQKAFTINIATTLTITTLNLPAGTKGVAYPSTQILASGGTPPYTWSISSGSLPPGLNLAPGTGAISGTPTASGSTVFTVVVTDSAGTTASVQLTLTVNSAAAPLSITTSGTVSAVAGTSFTGSSGGDRRSATLHVVGNRLACGIAGKREFHCRHSHGSRNRNCERDTHGHRFRLEYRQRIADDYGDATARTDDDARRHQRISRLASDSEPVTGGRIPICHLRDVDRQLPVRSGRNSNRSRICHLRRRPGADRPIHDRREFDQGCVPERAGSGDRHRRWDHQLDGSPQRGRCGPHPKPRGWRDLPDRSNAAGDRHRHVREQQRRTDGKRYRLFDHAADEHRPIPVLHVQRPDS